MVVEREEVEGSGGGGGRGGGRGGGKGERGQGYMVVGGERGV